MTVEATLKLHPPLRRSGLVPRPRLVERLDRVLGAVLTVVSAPAGYGKTTAVAEWVAGLIDRHPAVACRWITLDAADTDPARFCGTLLTAVADLDGAGSTAADLLRGGARPRAVAEAMVADLVDARPTVLVLDDYETVRTSPADGVLDGLLVHPTGALHLVVVSRTDPPGPVGRLRAAGQLVEIDATDLAFTRAETRSFLRDTMQLDVDAPAATAAHTRTEGWPAGLQLVGLAARHAPDPTAVIRRIRGTWRPLREYLVEQVVDRQPPALRGFLLRTAVLDRLSAPLCAAVVGDGDAATAQRWLEQLLAGHVFVTAADAEHRWFRCHGLLCDVLRDLLQRELDDAAVRSLHRRASDWYADTGLAEPAVAHALAARDWDRVAALSDRHAADLLRRGEVGVLLGWLRMLPDEEIHARPTLCRDLAWPLMLTGRSDQAAALLGRATAAAATVGDTFSGQVLTAGAYLARLSGDDDATIERSRRALELVPATDHTTRSVAAMNLGIALVNTGRLAEAEEALTLSDTHGARVHNLYARMTALAHLGRARALQGAVRDAVAGLRRAVRLVGMSPLSAGARIELAAIYYERDQLGDADAALDDALAAAEQLGNPELLLRGRLLQARVLAARGDRAAAAAVFADVEGVCRETTVSVRLRSVAAACRVEFALAAGDLGSARRHATEMVDRRVLSPVASPALVEARLLLAAGRRLEAATAARTRLRQAQDQGWVWEDVRARTLLALATPLPEADGHVGAAMTLVDATGFVRAVADAGPDVTEVLARTSAGDLRHGATARRIRRALPPARDGADLTARELEVLSLLAGLRTNREIADELVVSENTVKFHLKQAFRRLGVTNRRDAVRRARERGLLT